MDTLLTFQAANQSIGLIGKTVQIETNDGGQVGEVTTVTFKEGSPQLTIKLPDGEFLNEVRLSQVSVVR